MKKNPVILLLLIVLLNYFFPAAAQIEEIEEAEVLQFGLEAGSVMLNTGWQMPLIGFDCSALTPVQTENAVYWALRDGYRLIDISGSSGNEEAAGRAIRRAIEEELVTRDEIFITAGIWSDETVDSDSAIENALKLLGTEYIDLMILHQSEYAKDLKDYQAMERAAEAGMLRSIGLSGYSEIRNFDLIIRSITLPPAVLQTGTDPYHQNIGLKEYISQYGTILQARDPLGGKERQVLFADPVISSLATWYRKTSDQIILRWHLQRGNPILSGSYDEARIAEYLDSMNFELTESEMDQIDALERTPMFVYY